ncbi:MAG: hypothetical protein JWQ03_3074 [Variovorax sp.]|nr:hypothetical protein [Variovorax sp.]
MSRLAAFDPDQFVAAIENRGATAPPRPHAEMPMEWQRGLVRLAEMGPPPGAIKERWEQIVRDATLFAWAWYDKAPALGWTTGNIFGFDPKQPAGFIGLVLDIRGGRVVAMEPTLAAIRTPTGYHYHHRHMPDAATPVWALRGGR